jgi:hypothetical protein
VRSRCGSDCLVVSSLYSSVPACAVTGFRVPVTVCHM